MKSERFAWYYLITHGIAGHEQNQYGGFDYLPETKHLYARQAWPTPSWPFESQHSIMEKTKAQYMTKIREIGVDWKKTNAPSNGSRSIFEGTDAASGREEYLYGTLVLLNGEKQSWEADALEVSNVFVMMENITESLNGAVQLFGD